MRILFTHKPGGAYGYISESWMNICKNIGIEVRRWDNTQAAWDEYDPDLYVGCSGHKQSIPHNRRAKVAIHVNPYGEIDMGPINEPLDTIKWVTKVKPDVVFGYGFEKDRHYWSHWTTLYGIPWVPMANAADFTIFNTKYADTNKKYDVVYVGGKWTYKSKSMDTYLLPVLDNNQSRIVCGWGDWNKKYNVAPVTDLDIANVLSSGRIGPCISEPHTHQYGIDVPERVFKVIMSGTLAIHDNTQSLADQIPSLIIAANPKEFYDQCNYWINADYEIRLKKANAQRADVLKSHTYAHRFANLVKELGFISEADDFIRSVPNE